MQASCLAKVKALRRANPDFPSQKKAIAQILICFYHAVCKKQTEMQNESDCFYRMSGLNCLQASTACSQLE